MRGDASGGVRGGAAGRAAGNGYGCGGFGIVDAGPWIADAGPAKASGFFGDLAVGSALKVGLSEWNRDAEHGAILAIGAAGIDFAPACSAQAYFARTRAHAIPVFFFPIRLCLLMRHQGHFPGLGFRFLPGILAMHCIV